MRATAPEWPRVLLVVDSLQTGGAERHVVDLAQALAAGGSDVAVACSVAGPLADDLTSAGIDVEPLTDTLVKRRFSPELAAALRRLVGARRFDLVHAHIYASAAAAAAALAGTRIPLVVTEHTEAPWRGLLDRRISRLAYRRADRLIAVSTRIRRQLVDEFDVPAGKAVYVPNAVSPPPDEGVRARPTAAGRGPVVGRVARLAPEKGIDVFLRAAAEIGERLPEARFVVVGDGPVRGEALRLASELGLARRVDFLGERADARSIIAALDVLVVSSLSDGSPLVNLEAMAAGTPIVASRCGGIPDQIRDGVDGLLVPPGDARALSDAVLRVLEGPALARRLADSARRRAESEFSYDRMLARIEDCYRAAAAARTRSAAPSPTAVADRAPAA